MAIALVRAYQKWISPKKGFGCALRLAGLSKTGCSGRALRILRKDSLGWAAKAALLRRRLDDCSAAASARAGLTAPAQGRRFDALPGQGGFCDAGCDLPSCDLPSCDLPSCDLPSCDLPSCDAGSACDALSCAGDIADCGCDGCGRSEGAREKARARRQQRAEERQRRRSEKSAGLENGAVDEE